MNVAIVKDNKVVNMAVWDGVTPFNPPGDLEAVTVPDGVWIGWVKQGDTWVNPVSDAE